MAMLSESEILAIEVLELKKQHSDAKSLAGNKKAAYVTAINKSTEANRELRKAVQEKDQELALLRAFRDEVVAVIDNSQGVIGWHLNGDIAKWDELLPDVPY